MHRRSYQYLGPIALGLAVLASPAGAADADQAAATGLQHTDDILPDEVERRGAYVRLDVGGAFSPSPGVSIVAAPAGLTATEGGSIDGQVTFGGGVGYRFSNWFRSDVTVSHTPGRNFSAAATDGAGAAGTVSGSTSTTAVLANAYAEFVPESWIRPYAGGGLGIANVSVESVSGLAAGGGGQSYPDRSQWGFAWSLAAGVTMDVSERIELDAGYRYVNLGSAESGRAADGSHISLDRLEDHEFRLGVRFLFR